MRLLIATLAALLIATGADAQSKPVVIENAWVRLFEGNVTAYFHILNNAEQPDKLVSVSSPIADKVELIRTRVRAGRFSYLPLASLDIGGFDEERLRPGGLHLRLTGVNRRLVVGDTVPLVLRFERSGTIEVPARVSNQLLGNRGGS